MLLLAVACARPNDALPAAAAAPPPQCLPAPELAQWIVGEDGEPTGEVALQPIAGASKVRVMARLRLGRETHEWVVGESDGSAAVLFVSIPDEAVFSTIQELALSALNVWVEVPWWNGETLEADLATVFVWWRDGLDAPPVYLTRETGAAIAPAGVVGVPDPFCPEGGCSSGGMISADEVAAWPSSDE